RPLRRPARRPRPAARAGAVRPRRAAGRALNRAERRARSAAYRRRRRAAVPPLPARSSRNALPGAMRARGWRLVLPMALRPTVRVAAATGFLFLLCACDNVGRAFDRGGRGRSPEATTIATPSVGGTWFDGRPRVRAVFPKGSGWAPTAPVVIVFNEAIHEELAVPEQGDPLVFCRVKGATQRVPVSYHFLQGGNVLLIRPVPSWPAAQQQGAAPEIEVVVDPQLRDTDGIRLGSGGDPLVVGTFIPDADVQAEPDGRIVTTIPEDS